MLFYGFWQVAKKKVGMLPVVPTHPNLTIANPHWREMVQKHTYFHFSDLDL